jgi:Right handed beta helix region/Carbohydrate binding domain/Periplasmic copper-binding protein (NosD)
MTRIQVAIVAICGLLASAAQAATYYVDALSGNDLWSGKLAATNASSTDGPWKTIAKVNQITFAGGDSILFRCGRTWRDELVINYSGAPGKPITFASYGGCTSASNPVISGSRIVTNWGMQPFSGQIYVAPLPFEVAQVFVDGKYMRLARHPNKGVSSSKGVTNFASIQDVLLVRDGTQCPSPHQPCRPGGLVDHRLSPRSSGDIVGAGIHVRSSQFAYEDRRVAAYDATTQTVRFDRPTTYTFEQGYGYYLDNKLWMLDEPGEWFYDKNAQKLYLWLPAGDAPGKHTVEAAKKGQRGIIASARSNISIRNLRVSQTEDGIDLSSSTDSLISGVQVTDSGASAVVAANSSGLTIDRTLIDRSATQGIWAQSSTSLSVVNSQISNSGTVGSPRELIYAAIFCKECLRARITNNTIRNSAYAGIWYGNNSLISGNYVENSCRLMNDCAALGTSNADRLPNNSQVLNNIVVRTPGNPDGLPSGKAYPNAAIYLDDYSNHLDVAGNTTVDSDYGIMIHNGFANGVANNTVYGARGAALFIQEDGETPSVSGNRIVSNTFFPVGPNSSIVETTRHDAATAFASYDLNRYANPSAKIARESFQRGQLPIDNEYTLNQWQQLKGNDLGSVSAPAFGVAPYRIRQTNANNLVANGSFEKNGSAWQWYGAEAQLAWEPCATDGCGVLRSGASSTAALISSNFRVQAQRTYLVAFSLRAGRDNANVAIVVRKGGPQNYDDLAASRNITAGTSWQSYSYVFKANATTPLAGELGARIDFVLAPGDEIHVDNVRVQEVSVEYNQPSKNSMILLNPSATPRLLNCPFSGASVSRCLEYAAFKDGTQIVWPITLPANSSSIVLRANNPMKDSDFDGVADLDDRCPNTPIGVPVDEEGCSFSQRHPG